MACAPRYRIPAVEVNSGADFRGRNDLDSELNTEDTEAQGVREEFEIPSIESSLVAALCIYQGADFDLATSIAARSKLRETICRTRYSVHARPLLKA